MKRWTEVLGYVPGNTKNEVRAKAIRRLHAAAMVNNPRVVQEVLFAWNQAKKSPMLKTK